MNGRRNCRNKAAFSNLSSVVWRLPSYNILEEVFCNLRNNQGRGKCFQSAEKINRDLDYFGYPKKPNLTIVLIFIFLKKIATIALSYRTQFMFDKPSCYFAVRELDIVLGNHALRAQPTDYSLADKLIICRLRCFPELTVGFQPMRRQMVTKYIIISINGYHH